MEINRDKFYKIVSKRSGKVADVSGKSIDNGADIHQWEWHGDDNQRFIFFKLDGGYYAIANKKSGKVADVSGKSTDNGADIHQWKWHGDGNQLWILEDRTGGYLSIKSKKSGKVADVSGKSTSNGANIHQWEWHGDSNQLWKLEEVESVIIPSVQTQPLPDIPHLTSYADNLPDETKPVIVSYVLIPCIIVQDTWDEKTKMQNSPYYMLIRKQYWKKETAHVFAPHTTYRSSSTYGMSQTDQQTMTEKTGISVTADAGFSFEVFSASISTTVTRELEVSKSTTTQKMTEETIEETFENPTTDRIAWAKYALVNQYCLVRADGTEVANPWTVVDKNTTRETFWPNTPDVKDNLIKKP